MDRTIKTLRLIGLALMIANEVVKLRRNLRAANHIMADTDAAQQFGAATSEDAFDRAFQRAAKEGGLQR